MINEKRFLVTDEMTNDVVPFGKYKDRPVGELISDSGYCNWLSAQSWFRERYGGVYNLIVNYRGEPQDTPEHNEMQARFLDEDTRFQVVRGILEDGLRADEKRELEYRAEYDAYGYRRAVARSKSETLNIVITDEYQYSVGDPVFEQFNWDVTYTASASRKASWRDEGVLTSQEAIQQNWTLPEISFSASFALELKPSIGDDYPSILRKVADRRQKGRAAYRYTGFQASHYLVVAGRVASTVVTEDQVRTMFASQNVGLVILGCGTS